MACVLDPAGQYATAAECAANSACGWKYKCVDSHCIQAPDGTFATQEECFANCARFSCPMSVSGEAGSKPMQQYVQGANCNGWPCGKILYFPLVTFTAYKPKVKIAMSDGRVHVEGGSGDDYTEAQFVLIKYGNVMYGQPDPTSATVYGKGNQTLPLGADVVAYGPGPRSISGRDNQPVPGFNQTVDVQLGYQYQVAYQLKVLTNDNVEVSWPAVTVTMTD
jgi:hypothetical protein